jgi:hypothetical protein
MKRNENATCANCPYWMSACNGYGECRVNHPQYEVDGEDATMWPITHQTSWCGEHPEFWEILTAHAPYTPDDYGFGFYSSVTTIETQQENEQ